MNRLQLYDSEDPAVVVRLIIVGLGNVDPRGSARARENQIRESYDLRSRCGPETTMYTMKSQYEGYNLLLPSCTLDKHTRKTHKVLPLHLYTK